MKNLKCFLFVIMLLPIFLNGQGAKKDSSGKSSSNNHYFLGVSYSYNYCYRSLVKNSENSMFNTEEKIKYNNSIEKPTYLNTIGIDYIYVSKYFGMQVSTNYSEKGYLWEIDAKSLVFGDMIDTQYGFITPQTSPQLPWDKKVLIEKHIYLDIPIKFIMQYPFKNATPFITTGFVTDVFLARKQVDYQYSSDKLKNKKVSSRNGDDYKTFFFSYYLSCGVDIDLYKKTSFRLEPFFQKGFTDINNYNLYISEYLWSVGCNVGLYYKIF